MRNAGLFALALALAVAPGVAPAQTDGLTTRVQDTLDPNGDSSADMQDEELDPQLEPPVSEDDPVANDDQDVESGTALDDNLDQNSDQEVDPDQGDDPDQGAAGRSALPGASQAQSDQIEQPEATGSVPGVDKLDVGEVNHATFSARSGELRGASPLILKVQVLLDRAGASPGVIDGRYGSNVAKAIAAVETVLNLPVDGILDEKVWTALGGDEAPDVLVRYKITEDDEAGPFLGEVPQDYADQAKLKRLAYANPAEELAEHFHMDVELLKSLNPRADFGRAGTTITVAAVEGQPIKGAVTRIEVDKARKQVRAYDAQDRLVVAYPATIGSTDNPSPSGTYKVKVVAPDPVYNYDPENFVQGNNMNKLTLPPGPNNPVGDMWIGLSRPGYGIHGTPEPSRIDKTGSHGCVRLTNWDAKELATLVKPGVTVEFTE